MTKPIIRIHNLETDEVITREMTDEEFAASEKAAREHEAVVKKNEEIQKAKQEEKAILLNRLGITEDEARLLLGGN
jgi:hypothetical protein